MDCLGYFHDNCHSDITISKKTRASSCPSCVRIYANAVKDKSQKLENYKEHKKIMSDDTEFDNEGDDENSEGIDDQDYKKHQEEENINR